MKNPAVPVRLCIVILATALSGCVYITGGDQLAALDRAIREDVFGEPPQAEAAARARSKGPLDHYLVVRGRRNRSQGFVQTPPDTWAPFDVSIRTGIFEPEQAGRVDGARVCLELDTIGFTIFYDVCADWSASAGAWRVFAFHGPPAAFLPGEVQITAHEIELRTETDGTTLRFHAREAGAKDWSPVSQMPFPAQSPPLKMAFGATNVGPKDEIGFDSPSHASGPPPGPLTDVQQVVSDLNLALLRGLDAYLALDGGSPDLAAATASLAEAATALDAAAAGAAALAPSDDTETVSKRIAAADKALGKAQQLVDGGKAVKALGKLEKAALRVAQAVLILAPQSPLGL
jgi:hypothetical protein